MDLLRNTFFNREERSSICWSQDAIQMAYLGMTDQLWEDLKVRANSLDKETRFPAFWASANDWKPDQDNGGNLMNAFQSMLVQAEYKDDDQSIILFPAWSEDWDVKF